MLALTLFITTFFLLCSAAPGSDRKRPASKTMDKARIVSSCTVPNTAALTFDDGPSPYLEEVSDILKAKGARGTFFLNGNNYDCIYSKKAVEHMRYAYTNGHQIASHTWSHSHLPNLSYEQIWQELQRSDKAIQQITGAIPAFMRPPYGEYDDNVLRAAHDRGQTVALWDFDAGDAVGITPEESKERYAKVAAERPDTVLALNHDVIETTAHRVLPVAIDILQGAGYKLVTLADCLGLPAYQSVGPLPKSSDPSWKCW